jgi:hypothetical protein
MLERTTTAIRLLALCARRVRVASKAGRKTRWFSADRWGDPAGAVEPLDVRIAADAELPVAAAAEEAPPWAGTQSP